MKVWQIEQGHPGALHKAFAEQLHPRAENGRFGAGSNSSAAARPTEDVPRRSLMSSSKVWRIASKTHGMPVAYTGSSTTEQPVGGFKVAQLAFHPKPPDVTTDEHQALKLGLRHSIVSLRESVIASGMLPKRRGKLRHAVLIPEGTDRQTVKRAYNHSAALALHAFGVGNYDFAMSDELKTELHPLQGFMWYAQRAVHAHMLATQKGMTQRYKTAFGVPFADGRRDKVTNEVRRRVPPRHVLIKAYDETKHVRGKGGKFAGKDKPAIAAAGAKDPGPPVSARALLQTARQQSAELNAFVHAAREAGHPLDDLDLKIPAAVARRAKNPGPPVSPRALLQTAQRHSDELNAFVDAARAAGHPLDDLDLKIPTALGRRAKTGKPPSDTIATASGRKINVRYEVVPGAKLKQASGKLQPRERGDRMAYDMQVDEIASKLDPSRLMKAPEVDRGAPVVGPDHVIESGNGRVRAILQAAAQHPEKYKAYVDALRGAGHAVDGVTQPVLIARRTTKMNRAQRMAFVKDANTSATAALSGPEQARIDGQSLTPAMLSRYDPTLAPTSASNRAFVRSWMTTIPSSERNRLITAEDGSLSADGVRRLNGALLSRAYGSSTILARGLEATDDATRNISGALLDAAPRWAALKAEVDGGRISKDFDVAHRLTAAADKVRVGRERKQGLADILNQADVFSPANPVTDLFVRALFAPDGKRAASRQMIADTLNRFADEAGRHTTGAGLLDGAGRVTAMAALHAIVSNRDEHAAAQSGRQTSMFGRLSKVADAFDERRHRHATVRLAGQAAHVER